MRNAHESPSDYLECGIMSEDFDNEEESINILVHLKDKSMLLFSNIHEDPLFYNGWLNIDYDLVNKRMNAIIVESDVVYISYYANKKEK